MVNTLQVQRYHVQDAGYNNKIHFIWKHKFVSTEVKNK